MSAKQKLVAQNPLILRCHRLMEAFAKSDDERDFYVDRQEGFLIYVDLDKTQEELDELTRELKGSGERYCPIPKLTFYEIKKVMEGFVNEKVYDIDTKEKLLDIIQSKEARENFLEFIYDHHTELEKWQQFYQERFRVRIIEWLRNNQFDFVFEEDLELTKSMVEKLKMNLFIPKVSKDLLVQRKNLMSKAKTYYSSEALNPRPKRGRPPKQVAKVETEPQFSQDIYTQIPKSAKPFLFAPDYHSSSAIFTFSGKFTSEADLLAHRRQQLAGSVNMDLQNLSQKLAALRSISSNWNLTTGEQIKAGTREEERAASLALNGLIRPFEGEEEMVESKTDKRSPSKKEVHAGFGKPNSEKSSTAKRGFVKPSAVKPTSVKPTIVKPDSMKPGSMKPGSMKLGSGKPTKVSKVEVKQKRPKVAKPQARLMPVTTKKPQVKVASKPILQKSVQKKAPPKARLRPLPKKVRAAPPPKEKKVTKSKPSSLRHLRPAKKR